ncbi:MAG TPA: hypothetical protein VLH39_01105 [Magnetospirillaceae bacterium]|nr:hypothetical protein [Magnetospirillaceae bacterium]
MSIRDYLDSEPFFEIQRYISSPPQDAVVFTGTPRMHPYDDRKFILVGDPTADEPVIFEFLAGDIVHAEDLASPVTQSGETYPRVRLWIRRGSMGIRYEPFEVDTPLRFFHLPQDHKVTRPPASGHRD